MLTIVSTMSTTDIMNSPYWIVLQDGRKGTDGQAVGLAEAMGVPYTLCNVRLPIWQRAISPLLIRNWVANALYESYRTPPVGVIGTGHRATYGLLAASYRWSGVHTIQIENTHINAGHFTYVVAPEHDQLEGRNVISTLGSLQRITPSKLADARAQWQEKLSRYAAPRVAVLIGGNNKYVRLHTDWADDVIAKLYALIDRGMSVFITISRRTPEALVQRFRRAFPHPNVWFWDGVGDNPYFGFLAYADRILVTADSVTMISEALATEVPVALLRMPGEGRKFTRFYDALFAAGQTHWYDGDWKITARARLQETERVAALLREKLGIVG